ncbi:tetratricopeptide repeat protein [Heyndrickxia ginsengihumi]|uniref:tetratricopeptide repeat protein n=1 Tax=Heyndrickxia ginsengihumi TaxID=363870 RepID=UPI00203E83E5|nr:tetratricopeptide repeat protein [Heyndrickxia ginsengihumi]MCM3022929.1 tetratricopeptide repeat protein [Heyndrickxia ginsengihumi]
MSISDHILQHIENGNMEQVTTGIRELLSSNNDEEKYNLAQQLFSLGFLQEAQQLYKHLLEQYPDDGELHILLAETFIDMDQEEEAIFYLDSVSEEDANYPRALLLLADLYQMQGLLEVSERKLLSAKSILPEEPVIDFALAEFYASEARYSDAVNYYEELLKKGINNIGDANIYIRLAEVLSSAGKFEDALQYYEKAMDDHIDINTLFGYGFTAYQAGFYKKAIVLFNQLKEMDPEYHSLYLYLGRSYEHEEEIEKALETVKQGIAFDEYNKELFHFGAKIALKLGQEDVAEEFFKKALDLDQGYIEAALTYNKLLLHQERYEEVVELTANMENEGDVDPQLYWDMAIAYQYIEEFSEALKYYELAYNDLKHNQQFLSEYGYFLIEEGKRDQAIAIFKDLLAKEPTNEEWISLLERLEFIE